MGRNSISIVMTTYNGQAFLQEQLESISSQSRAPDELIIADDASQDATLEIVRDFEKISPFRIIIVERDKNIGYARNFIDSLNRSTGDIIFFSDQDDIWNAKKIETIEAKFETTDNLLISHDFQIIDEFNNVILQSYYDSVRSMNISPTIVVHGCAMACRRDLINIAELPTPRSYWAHDTWLCGIATALCSRGHITQPLIQHRLHRRNTSGWFLWPKSCLKSMAYKIGVPPFTASSDFDFFLEFYGTAENLPELESRFRTAAVRVGEKNTAEALKSFSRKRAMLEFRADNRYGERLFRLGRCASLFSAQAYRTGGRLPGLAEDLLGRRRVTATIKP
jgi:glycosyltransferase involved in cell wall biosynthesis